METALISGKSPILPFLLTLQKLIQQKTNKFHIGHIWDHNKLPGPLALDNAMANLLTQKKSQIYNAQKAQKNHKLHHQNALALKKMFSLTQKQARQIIKKYGHYPPSTYHPPKMEINPRGLKPNII